ncbi:MAG: N-acetyl-gamma-glutamyl-phosphate reductase [Ferruginibacter sp.]
MQRKIRAGIIGGAGYTGGELIRILLHHSVAEVTFVQSTSNAGKSVADVHGDLLGDTNLIFAATHHFDVDVLFFCSGHGAALQFVKENNVPAPVKLIDLGNDFRLSQSASMGNRKFLYGLPEVNREAIRKADSIANPGCFATAIQLGLLPLAKENMLSQVYTTGITGSTGAGQTLSATSHFSWRSNNIQAYKTLTHQHLAEIGETLSSMSNKEINIHFVPWRGDFARGIFTSSQFETQRSLDEIYETYNRYYESHPFVVVSRHPVHLKQAVNTNKCFIQIEKEGNIAVVHSAIDNLLKGASGQAVQNMNLMFGLEESMGLKLKANYF